MTYNNAPTPSGWQPQYTEPDQQQPAAADPLAELAAAGGGYSPYRRRRAGRKRPMGVGVVLLASVVAVVVASCAVTALVGRLGRGAATANGDGSAPAAARGVRRGDDGQLTTGGPEKVMVAVSKSDFDRMNKLAAARDTTGILQMVLADRVLVNERGTRCRMIDPGILTSEVRIMDGRHAGKSGFVSAEFVVR